MGVWGQGPWTEPVCCGARGEGSQGPAHQHSSTALDFRLWRGSRNNAHDAQDPQLPLLHSISALLCRGETEAQRGHLFLDCTARSPGPKKAKCLDTEALLKEVSRCSLGPTVLPLLGKLAQTGQEPCQSHSWHRATLPGYLFLTSVHSLAVMRYSR